MSSDEKRKEPSTNTTEEPASKRPRSGLHPFAEATATAAVNEAVNESMNEALGDSGMKDDEGSSPLPLPPTVSTRASAKGKKKAPQSHYNTIPGGKEKFAENFDHYLFQILLFRADHNNFHIPRDRHPDLHAWLQFLKREYKRHVIQESLANNSTSNSDTAEQQQQQQPLEPNEDLTAPCSLTPEQVKVLQSLHVPLTSRGDEHWNRFYDLLCEYKDRHGHVLVPRLCETPGLGDWVTDQRRQYKALKQGQPTQLTQDRRAKLDALGFVYVVRNRPEWDDRYKELLDYKERFGDCKVPQHYKANKALGKWVAKQREQYKLLKKGEHSFLTPYRLERLNAAGFVWQVRTALDSELFSSPASAAAPPAEASSPAPAVPANPAPKATEDDGDEGKELAAV